MVKKSIKGIPQLIYESISVFDKQLKVILFGSRARGEEVKDSDWDFLILTERVVTNSLRDQIWAAIYEIELQTGEVISSLIEHQETWKNYQQTAFYKNVQKEGIEIVSKELV